MMIINKIRKLWFNYRLRRLNPSKRSDLLRPLFYHIGENVELYTTSFGTEPYLINIEDDVVVASSVRFVNHDVSCFRMAKYLGVPKESVDKVGPITLHKNCFVGAYTTLMPGCSVGCNSVVAACSVVTKHIPDGEVWGGVPAKFIMKTDEYAKRVVEQSKKYPWIEKKKFMSKEEIVRSRQEFFFEQNDNGV